MSYIFILLLCFIYIVGDDGVCLSASKKVYVCCSQILEETYGDGRRLIAEKEEKRQHSCRWNAIFNMFQFSRITEISLPVIMKNRIKCHTRHYLLQGAQTIPSY